MRLAALPDFADSDDGLGPSSSLQHALHVVASQEHPSSRVRVLLLSLPGACAIARARNRTWTLLVRSQPLCPLSHAGLSMGAMGLEPIPPVLETGCLPFGEAPADDDGGRSRTGVFSLCGGAHSCSATPSLGRNGGDRTLSCRATACHAAGTPRSSSRASEENRTPMMPLTGRPLGQFERRWHERSRIGRCPANGRIPSGIRNEP